MRVDQARRLKELERENARLKKLVADLSLDNAILKEASQGNFQARRGGGRQWREPALRFTFPKDGRARLWGSIDRRSGVYVSFPPKKSS
jgi:hypothetical protein